MGQEHVLEKNDFKCLRCGHEWESKVQCPSMCPKCHSPNWDVSYNDVRINSPTEPSGTINLRRQIRKNRSNKKCPRK